MSDEIQKKEEAPVEPVKLTTLERIQVLGNLANAVQNDKILQAFNDIPGGDRLYAIFTEAVSREIESMMNPASAAPKEMVDAASVAQNLRAQIVHMYQAITELNNTRLVGVLTVLNTSLGGNTIGAAPQAENMLPVQQQGQPQQTRPSNSTGTPAPTQTRNSGTGMNW